MKQTAVEWLNKEIERLTTQAGIHISWQIMDDLIQQAKEIEKEQHLKTWTEALYCETGDKQAFEKYYNETFKSE
jgi:hypothetical protein